MSYQGGKAKLGKRIYDVIDILEEYLADDYLEYVEPFVGFCGVMKHFGGDQNRPGSIKGYDANKDVIEMWKALQTGWKPPIRCSRAKYNELKHSNEHSAERGFVGVACGYSGIFFAGYREKLNYKSGSQSSMAMTSRSVIKTANDLDRVKFINKSYEELSPKNCLVYCDPPYKDNKYSSEFFVDFDTDEFWETMRRWSKDNIVVVSERIAPDDFNCIWKSTVDVIHSNKTKNEVEKLFIYKGLYKRLDKNIKDELMSI